MHRKRYAVIPLGLVRQSDLEAQGKPETLIEAYQMRVFGLLIKAGDALLPDGDSHAMLAIRAVENGEPGGEVTMAIAASVPFTREPVNLQSNPRGTPRTTERGQRRHLRRAGLFRGVEYVRPLEVGRCRKACLTVRAAAAMPRTH